MITNLSAKQTTGCEINLCFARSWFPFIIVTQSTPSTQPSKCSLDHPSVDRRVFRPTLGTRTSCPRSEGAVEIDPARLGIEGHVNDLPGSRKPERNGKQLQWV